MALLTFQSGEDEYIIGCRESLPPQISYFADGLIGMDFLLQFKKFAFDFDEKVIETFEAL